MPNKNLVIVSNESIYVNNNKYFCDNVDIKSTVDGLSKLYNLIFLGRGSFQKRNFIINFKNIKVGLNIFSYLYNIFKTLNTNSNYLIISITPFTFFAFLILFLFRKKIFIYLRSNGFKEYEVILGKRWVWIYKIMYSLVLRKSHIISCQQDLVINRKFDLVTPSELDEKWLYPHKEALLEKVKLLYVGRIKIEKGIYSLIDIFNDLKIDSTLSIVGVGNRLTVNNSNIKFYGFENDITKLSKIYDEHNITILPSFTEGYPKVVLESLARSRPIIAFEEIIHISENRHGVFICKRNSESLSETIQFIIQNYSDIQKKISKNQLPEKKDFIKQISNILDKN